MTDKEFIGVKAAVFIGERLLVYQRDNKPELRFAGMWDFFGGGREPGESPFRCIQRELQEELEITITEDQIRFTSLYPAMHDSSLNAYFMVVQLSDSQAAHYRFGSEGQQCKLVTVQEFLDDESAIEGLKVRLADYVESRNATTN